jgi:Abortive infection C-terminus
MAVDRIPAATIGLLSQILPEYYTHDSLNGLFLTASAPDNIPEGSKPSKVTTWLRLVNNDSEKPLNVLGNLLADFMDRETYNQNRYSFGGAEEYENKRNEAREKIVESLAKDGLSYSRGGHITKGGYAATLSLRENVIKRGFSAIEIEIKRALANVESDPLAAIHNAGCVLEASLKAYLTHHSISYKDESDTLSDLWKQVVDHIGIHPKELDDRDLKKIASGLFNIVDGIMHLRNKKSSAHGKSEEQLRQSNIRPRHARLAIHAAHTLSAYILELTENSSHIKLSQP